MDSILIYLYGRKTRWFNLHACYNCVIVGLSCDYVYEIILNPSDGFLIDSTVYSVFIYGFMLHIYHCIYFKLKMIDYIHHISSVFFPMMLMPNVIPHKFISLYVFIGSGLPGGLEYFTLVFYKNGLIDKLTQKKWACNFNVYLRIPGGVFACTYGLLSIKSTDIFEVQISSFILLTIIYLNVTIFDKMALKSYGEQIILNNNLKTKVS